MFKPLDEVRVRGYHVDDIARLSSAEHGFFASRVDFLYNIIERGRSNQVNAVSGRGHGNDLPKEARD